MLCLEKSEQRIVPSTPQTASYENKSNIVVDTYDMIPGTYRLT